VGQQDAARARQSRRDHKRHHFVARSVDAHRLGGEFVFPNRDQRPAESGVDDVEDDDDRQNRDQEDPEETLDDGNA
jgi:hypothetical protein